MAKLKLSDFKKFVSQMSGDEAKEELIKLAGKISQVQDYYAQELMSPQDRRVVLDSYKKKIYNQFWTRGGNPRNTSNAEVRKIITEFEKISVMPTEVIELLLYRVDLAIDQANQFGGLPDNDYNAALNAYEKALKIIVKEHLESQFANQCEEIAKFRDNMDYWVMEQMQELNSSYLNI
ncbi:MAG: hypothetical protein JNL70_13875 [Saprospiraceae bacterium]|nr:hypothetical protein [Saprospiraceae bacterium]